MNHMKLLLTYLATLLSLGILDAFWLTFVAKEFYAKHLGFLLSKTINFTPIAVFYPVYALAVTFLVVMPALEAHSLVSALWRGALLGLAAYSAYDLTNHATIASWPLIATVVDIAWGVTVTALAGAAAYLIMSQLIINDFHTDMKGFYGNIEKETLENGNFRKVLYTGKHSQLVLMTLKPKEEIGMEIHTDNDQFFRFESGQGKSFIDGNEYDLHDGVGLIIPAGAKHNIVNTSDTEDLKMYTIYSPAHHKDGIIRATKAEAEADAPDFDGKTTE